MNKNVLQEGEDWLKQRRGLFTGSEASVLMSKGRGKDFTDTGMTYIYKKAAERLGSHSFQTSNAACKWGENNEPKAIELYEQITGVTIEQVGFVKSEQYGFVGCSVDGLEVGESSIIEVKCPYAPENHLKYAYDLSYVKKKHNHQMQHGMYVWDVDFCDFITYDPRSDEPIFIHRIERDDEYIEKMIQRFCLAEEVVQEIVERLQVGVEF